ncbi:MAG: hypothetical protein H6849_01830 [Alphaproteobacteria bacterium]|nr:MAG: hypothetical protein H6849_01830 [Alphaproteobacteria bacterium]
MSSIKFFFIIFFTAFHICASSSRDEQEGIGTNPDEIRSAIRETIAFIEGRVVAVRAAADFLRDGELELAEAAYGQQLNHDMVDTLSHQASLWSSHVREVALNLENYNSFQRLTEDDKRINAPGLFARQMVGYFYRKASQYHNLYNRNRRFLPTYPELISLESFIMKRELQIDKDSIYYADLRSYLFLRSYYAYMSPRDCRQNMNFPLGETVSIEFATPSDSLVMPSHVRSATVLSVQNAMRVSLNEHLAANKAFSDYIQGKTNRIPGPREFTIIGKDESGRALPHLQITPELEAAILWISGYSKLPATDKLAYSAWGTVMADWVQASTKRKKAFKEALVSVERNGNHSPMGIATNKLVNASFQARRPSKEAVARARRILRGEPADVGSGVGAGGGSKPEAAAASPSKTKGRRKKGSNKKRSAAPQRPEIAVARAPLASAEPSVAAQNQAKLLEEEARLQKERDAADAENERQWGIIHAVNQALSHRRQVLRSGDSSASAPQAASQAVSVDDRAEAASVSPGVFRSQELPVARVLLSNLGANNGLRRFADLLNTPGGSMINGFAIRQGLEALQRIFPDSFVLGEMEGSRVRVRHPNLPYPLTLHLHSGMISQDARSTRSAYRVLLDHLVVDDIDGELVATGSGGGE